jgi:opacity protein-like surface antigen
MSSLLTKAVAVAGLCVIACAGKSQAQSGDEALHRLEARLDALAKENASLRDRVRRIESSRRVTEALPRQTEPALAPVAASRNATPNPSHMAREAHAAATPVKALAMPGCPGSRFHGGYVGAHGGGVSYTANRTDSDSYLVAPIGLGTGTYVSKSWGGVVGGQIGYNWTRCNVLWGVEVDGSWMSAEASASVANFPGILAQVTSRLDGLVTARARAGVALDNLLFYVTGGVAAAHTRTDWSTNFVGFIDSTETLSTSAWRYGWVGGFGTEWALTDRLSVRSEALYVDLVDRDYVLFSPVLDSPTHFKNSDSMWVARIGVNYKLWE